MFRLALALVLICAPAAEAGGRFRSKFNQVVVQQPAVVVQEFLVPIYQYSVGQQYGAIVQQQLAYRQNANMSGADLEYYWNRLKQIEQLKALEQGSAPSAAVTAEPVPPEVANGEAVPLYRLHCGKCHGTDVLPGPKDGRLIAQGMTALQVRQAEDAIAEGTMPKLKDGQAPLDPETKIKLIEEIRELWNKES